MTSILLEKFDDLQTADRKARKEAEPVRLKRYLKRKTIKSQTSSPNRKIHQPILRHLILKEMFKLLIFIVLFKQYRKPDQISQTFFTSLCLQKEDVK